MPVFASPSDKQLALDALDRLMPQLMASLPPMLATMKSMNSATPAWAAPGVSSAGMISSARCATSGATWPSSASRPA